MKNNNQIFKIVNLGFILLVFVLFFSGFVFSGCGKKGPPKMIEKSEKKLQSVDNINYQIKGSQIVLKWESDYKQAIEGFEIFMARQNIKKCQGCPVVYVRIDSVADDVNQDEKELKKGYRYFFKIITSGTNNIKSSDSEIVKIEFE